MKVPTIEISGRKIGDHQPAFIIAELSANHRQNLDLALQTMQAAAQSGADAIKLQTYTPDTITMDSREDCFLIQQNTIWDGQYLYDLYREAYTPWEWHERLFQEAAQLGLICFSSVFDSSSIEFLETLKTPAYKIASFEIHDLPMIRHAATKRKPMLISTGIARIGEIEEAVDCCHEAGNEQVALLKCVSAYPTPLESIHLATIPHMKEAFGRPVGLSDHSLGFSVAIGAVALGACIIEKHFILDRSLGGPDVSFSMEPAEFRMMVQGIRDIEKAKGEVSYQLTCDQTASRAHARSLFAVRDIRQGERFTTANIRSIRPANGLPPKYYPEVLGKKARHFLTKGTPLKWDDIDEN